MGGFHETAGNFQTAPGGGTVTDNIGTVGTILLCDGRFGQEAGLEVVHSDG